MILTCPACSVRYVVDPRALGAGRMVRCARCGHTWRQDPDETAAATPGDAAVPVLEPALASPRLEVEPRLRPAPVEARPRSGGRGLARFLVLLLVLGGLAAGAYFWRGQIVGLWPGAEQFYALIGVPVDVGLGLELRKVTPTRETENGLPALVVAGEVANTTAVPRPVPKLTVTLRDKSGKELKNWSVNVTDQPLKPGASVPFRTSIAQPPDAATDVVVTFAPSGG